MEKPYFSDKDSEDYSLVPPNEVDQTLAIEFGKQVDEFYSLPRPSYNRREVVFSPSGVTQCARQLYYQNTNAKQDEQSLVPWRERMSRNGTGSHDVTQADYLKMDESLRKAGKSVKFKFLEAEIKGERSFTVNGRVVKLRGRSDGKVGLLDENGEVVKVLGWEKKTKDKRKNLNKIMKAGQPQEEHRKQAVAYALIWGIQDWIFEYEALAKPEWGDTEPEKPDIAHFFITVDRDEAKALLIRLSKIVEAIEKKELPQAELDKCGFCPFKETCSKDGGYVG